MRRRILITAVAVAALAVLAFSVPTALALRNAVRRSDLLELQREAAIVASRVRTAGSVDVAPLRGLIKADHDLAFYDGSGELVDGTGPATADDIVATAVRGDFAEGYVGGDLVVAVPLRPTADGPELVVRVREPAADSRRRMTVRFVWLGAAAVAVLGVAGVIGWLLARRLSRPLEGLREHAAALGRAEEVAPMAVTGVVEIDELATAMDDAGSRIRELLGRERSFSSNVSHQLRTPVAALRVAIEAELDAPRPDPTLVLNESLVALDRLGSTITSLLALGRHDEVAAASCDAAAVVADVVARWSPTFAAAGRTVSVAGAAGRAAVDPASIRHIVDVLLDNTLTHGRGAVTATMRDRAGWVEVDIADEGRIPPAADPFGDERLDAGHGIGLRLARTLAESARGELEVVAGEHTVFRLRVLVGASGDDPAFTGR
ncbi:MAG: HAMP domain-containing sensor histidine kinase [Ilumatobacteraceae bacterium]